MTILLDSLFVKLRIISKIPADGRLSTTYPDNITVEYNGSLQCLKRTFFRESRKDTVKVLKELVDSIIEASNYLMNSIYLNIYTLKQTIPTTQELEQFQVEFKDLDSIKDEIDNSLKGFINLKNTYKHDAKISSDLEVMVKNLQIQNNKIKNKINLLKSCCDKKKIKKGEIINNNF